MTVKKVGVGGGDGDGDGWRSGRGELAENSKLTAPEMKTECFAAKSLFCFATRYHPIRVFSCTCHAKTTEPVATASFLS